MFNELNKVYSNSTFQAPSGLGTFEGLAAFVANLLVTVAGSVAFITLAYAFVQFSLSQGDPKSFEKAQHAALYSGIAILIAALTYGIKSAVFRAVGAE
jgi:hypothetical protein